MSSENHETQTHQENHKVANVRAMLSDFEGESLEGKYGILKHAIAELQNAERGLPDEY